jgi:hypothetical protein
MTIKGSLKFIVGHRKDRQSVGEWVASSQGSVITISKALK